MGDRLTIVASGLGTRASPFGPFTSPIWLVAMLGALVIGIASELAAAVVSPDYKDVVAFVILVMVLLARPQGILSEIATRKEVAA